MKRSTPFALLALTGSLLSACAPQPVPDGVKPTISLTAAPTTVTSAGTVTLSATATDNVGVTKVDFYQGTTLIGSDTTEPYSIASANITSAQNGTLTYRAVASDAAGNTAEATTNVTVNIDVTAPTVSVTADPATLTAAGTVTFTATATSVSGVTKVDFYDNGTLISTDTTAPYSASKAYTAADNGTRTITATATNSAGKATTATTTLKVGIDAAAPTVTLSATPNPVTAAGDVKLTASAQDDVGVTKVEFYNGSTKISEDMTAPYEAVVSVNALMNGQRTYTAVAYDAAGRKTSADTVVTVNITSAAAPLKVTVVDQNIGAPVTGSTVSVYQNGQLLGNITTDASGQLNLSGLPAGSYDLKARKAGMAGSDLYGVMVGTQTPSVQMVQRPAFDTSATTNPATLVVTRADGSPLAGATFTGQLDFRIKTAADSDHVGPIRIVYAQLGRTPGSGGITASPTAANWNYSPKQDALGVVDSGPVTTTGNFTAGFGSAAGEQVYLEIMAVDYNYNYVRHVIPVKLINADAAAQNTVVAPTAAAATAFTLKQEGSWTTPYGAGNDTDAAPNGSGVFVEVRWCYTNTTATAKPFAFDVERSSDGATFSKIGTVGGGASTSCSATNQASRPFAYRDTSAELAAGKTFTYRVVARGTNTAASNTTQTTPLAQFTPTFIAPADESTGVSVNPTFVLGQNQTAIGADGAAYNIRVRDLMTLSGYNLPGSASNALLRVEEGTGATGNGIPVGQSLVFTSTGSVFGKPTTAASVLTDTSGTYVAAKPNLMPVNTTAHTFSMPWNVLVATPLQPLRPYKWELYSGLAYKYAPSEGNRISAYSVFTWPASTDAPVLQTRPVNINWDFITGQ
ncbi:Ig-like domain-containing protein [Deinococcus sedimenti]|uniref:Carboxypeptidase regulatory-like domain-containing protein n=1 Tax=Deinococcus sedimenti TaxID=1867090 RepID=A0ABQ2S6Q6_9DEIO|nr:Ig-like domain-containing protein [Deinococcus sedimenti]GGS02322.1 hypothetical protein GCM10008960_31240 [Deinococcus sedimenti]